jgi:hypothetical protein
MRGRPQERNHQSCVGLDDEVGWLNTVLGDVLIRPLVQGPTPDTLESDSCYEFKSRAIVLL